LIVPILDNFLANVPTEVIDAMVQLVKYRKRVWSWRRRSE